MLIFLLGLSLAGLVVAPPPMRSQAAQQQQPAAEQPQPAAGAEQANQEHAQEEPEAKPMYQFAYQKYLEEVVKILESDPKFTEKLKGMKEDDIKAGNIADHIEDLDDHVFDKLHKAKFEEIERLRQQIEKQIEADGGAHNVKMPEHLDVDNWEKFGREDLRKLIRKTVADMEELDKERKQDFKEYEMKKKAEEDHKFAQMDEEHRKKAQAEADEAKARHNEHEKLKHPGSRDQLEEVWEESDQMDKDSFDPKTFFALHDLNGDGFWNADELEALFRIELDKMYNETNPDDDPKERMEEMYRMREHVTNQMDKNNDRMISLQEFLMDTEAQTPEKDPGWKDLAQQELFTDEELAAFEKDYAAKQGWGEQAYETTTVPASHPPPVQQVPVQPQQVNPSIQVNSIQDAQPIVDLPKDPSYGI